MSRWLSCISRDGDSIHNFVGQTMPILSHPHSKNVFPGVYKERAVSDCAHQLLPITGHHWKEPCFILIHIPALQVFVHIYVQINLLFAMLNRSISHNFPLCKWYPNPLVTVMGLHWSLSCGSIISLVQFFKLQLNLTAVFIFCLLIVPRLWKGRKKFTKETTALIPWWFESIKGKKESSSVLKVGFLFFCSFL